MEGQAELLQWGQGGTELMLPCNIMSRLFCSGEKKLGFNLYVKSPLMERTVYKKFGPSTYMG